ncbi:twin-arginine translocase subunit TatC [Staphylococcus sp. SQ8-PEA]|uniref:Sec-independent protein translocase protein TatC n=1 Tax=Staphylococcus marylandisciuri TaxID=2981529 RepID=A0ABT2QMT0_9STAP|nr:twin-arginine translocase subunit TatC [Staphylococcus marylandisciuri]MCU5745265.1 twin-arginine translocase subunit TatC [Staphylococcus marylandisciuri]
MEELRQRLIVIAGTLVIVIVILYLLSNWWLPHVLHFILPPSIDLHAFGVTELIQIYIKVIFFISLCVCTPVIFYHIWAFIIPGLEGKERYYILKYGVASLILFIIGVLCAFFIVYPYIINWANNLSHIMHVQPLIGLKQYLNELIRWLLTFGVLFQLPVLFKGLAYFQIIDVYQLKHYRKYVYFFSFVLASLIAPPDIIMNLILTLPIILLFEISMVWVKWTRPKHNA